LSLYRDHNSEVYYYQNLGWVTTELQNKAVHMDWFQPKGSHYSWGRERGGAQLHDSCFRPIRAGQSPPSPLELQLQVCDEGNNHRTRIQQHNCALDNLVHLQWSATYRLRRSLRAASVAPHETVFATKGIEAPTWQIFPLTTLYKVATPLTGKIRLNMLSISRHPTNYWTLLAREKEFQCTFKCIF